MHPLVKAYHRLLVWDIAKAPALTRTTERLLNPVLGKSLVVYSRKPVTTTRTATLDTAAQRPESASHARVTFADSSGNGTAANGAGAATADAGV